MRKPTSQTNERGKLKVNPFSDRARGHVADLWAKPWDPYVPILLVPCFHFLKRLFSPPEGLVLESTDFTTGHIFERFFFLLQEDTQARKWRYATAKLTRHDGPGHVPTNKQLPGERGP